jgi:hypothetical protein
VAIDLTGVKANGRFVLGYTGEIGLSEDHFIMAARVTQNANDVHALVQRTDEVEHTCWRSMQPERSAPAGDAGEVTKR